MTVTMTAGPEHDQELLAYWRCGKAGHGDCFSSRHMSANRVAWEAARHTRTCACWQHAVLRAIGWSAVTGEPGSPHAVFEDASLPHQPSLLFSPYSGISLTCTCLGRRHGPKQVIETRTGTFPAREAMAAYRQWHIDHGELVWP